MRTTWWDKWRATSPSSPYFYPPSLPPYAPLPSIALLSSFILCPLPLASPSVSPSPPISFPYFYQTPLPPSVCLPPSLSSISTLLPFLPLHPSSPSLCFARSPSSLCPIPLPIQSTSSPSLCTPSLPISTPILSYLPPLPILFYAPPPTSDYVSEGERWRMIKKGDEKKRKGVRERQKGIEKNWYGFKERVRKIIIER